MLRQGQGQGRGQSWGQAVAGHVSAEDMEGADQEAVCVCDRHSLCLSQTVCVCNIQPVSFTDSLCLSQTDYVCHRQFVSVTDCLCPSQAVCVCHRQSVSVTDSLCLSQTIFVSHRQSVSVTDTFLDHSWPGFHLFIHDFHQDLSVRFEFVRYLNMEVEELRKAGSWMREHTYSHHGGVFSEVKTDDYEFLMIGVHRKVLRRQLEEAILIDWAQERGVIRYRGCVNKIILNSQIEHWRPRPVFIVGR